jgi:hypothetical protein
LVPPQLRKTIKGDEHVCVHFVQRLELCGTEGRKKFKAASDSGEEKRKPLVNAMAAPAVPKRSGTKKRPEDGNGT